MRDPIEEQNLLVEKPRHPQEFEQARSHPGSAVYLRSEPSTDPGGPHGVYVIYCSQCEAHTVRRPSPSGWVICRGCHRYDDLGPGSIRAKAFRQAVSGAVGFMFVVLFMMALVRLVVR